MTTYKESGVDVSRAADALARIKERVGATKRPEVIGDIGAFGGLFRFGGLRDAVLVATTDGVGTKLELARLLDRHEGVGADLVNHCVNDALAMGAEPLFFLDYFSTSKLEPEIFARVVGAMADACRVHGCALLGGEQTRRCTSFAPCLRRSATIGPLVEPRTMLSSMTTTRWPASTSCSALYLSAMLFFRSSAVGWMNVRPM